MKETIILKIYLISQWIICLKDFYEKVEMMILEFRHKIHKKMYILINKKYEVCPIYRLESNIKEKNIVNKQKSGENDKVNFYQIVKGIRRIYAKINEKLRKIK